MKKSLLIVLSLFGSAAFACPDFSGNYICSQSGESDQVIVVTQTATEMTQLDSDGPTTIPLNGETTIMLDWLPANVKGRCDDKTFEVTISVPNLFSLEMKLSKTENGYINESKDGSGQTSVVMTCVRK